MRNYLIRNSSLMPKLALDKNVMVDQHCQERHDDGIEEL
jgi:hypothetical protein